MKKTLYILLFCISTIVSAQDVEHAKEFFQNVPYPRLVMSKIINLPDGVVFKISVGAYYQNTKTIYIDPKGKDLTATYLHEFTHYVIHIKKIDLKGLDAEYVCSLVEAIYMFEHQDSKGFLIGGTEFWRKHYAEYVAEFNKIFE